MAGWFRRSNSESTKPGQVPKPRTEPVNIQPINTHGSGSDFEDVELAELDRKGLPQVEVGTPAEDGVLNEVIREAHDKERKLLVKVQTQERKLRQNETDLQDKDKQMAALKAKISDLNSQLEIVSGPLSTASSTNNYRTPPSTLPEGTTGIDVDEHRHIGYHENDNRHSQPDSMDAHSRRPHSYDHETAELAVVTELSVKEVEIEKLKNENKKLKDTMHEDSCSSCEHVNLREDMKKENNDLKARLKVLDNFTVSEGENEFSIVSKESDVLIQKEGEIEVLQDQVDEFRECADRVEQLQEHSRLQSKHVMELKQELGATQMTYDELKEYTQSLEGTVEELETPEPRYLEAQKDPIVARGLHGPANYARLQESLRRAGASGSDKDQAYWEESMRTLMTENEECKKKLWQAETREKELQRESDSLKKSLTSMGVLSAENSDLQKKISTLLNKKDEQATQLEIARTEAGLYKEDFQTERRDREEIHGKYEILREQSAADVVVWTEEIRILKLELEKYQTHSHTHDRRLTGEMKEARDEVQAKNVQVRQYKKQVDQLTNQLSEQERRCKDLIQEMTKVRKELEKQKKDKPSKLKKGEKTTSLTEVKTAEAQTMSLKSKFVELEHLYDDLRKENEGLKDVKRVLSTENLKLSDEKMKVEQENQQLRKAGMTLKKTLQDGPPVRAKLLPGDTPEGSAALLSPSIEGTVMSPSARATPLPRGTTQSAEQERIRSQLKQNFQHQEAQKLQKLQKFDNEINDLGSEAGVGNYGGLPAQQPQQAPFPGNYGHHSQHPNSTLSPRELQASNEIKPIVKASSQPQAHTPPQQAFSLTYQPQAQSSPVSPLSISQQVATHSEVEAVEAVMETQSSDAKQSPVYNQSAPAAFGSAPVSDVATQSKPKTSPLVDNERDIASASDQKKRVTPSPKVSPIEPPDSIKEYDRDLQQDIDKDIEEVAADVVELVDSKRAKQMTNVRAPYDPNLVCPMCMKQFRIGEIQKFRKHVLDCKGSAGMITEC